MASTARDDPTTRDVLGTPSRAGRPGLVRRFARNPFAAAAVVYLLAIVLAAVFAPLLTRYAPDRIIIGQELQPPSAAHWFGTDQSARDEFSRLLYGARISLAIGIIAMLLSVTFGTAVGAVSGFFGGATDAIGMRLTDAMLAIPVFFLLLAVLASVGSSVPTIILAIGLSSWMATARVVRSEVLRTANLDFVTAARVLGATRLRLLVRHVLPQAFPSMLVASTLGVGQAILIESALSYLGVGVQPPTASWGNMLSNAQSYVFAAPLLALWPGLFILLTVLSFNFIGDASRDALSPYQT